ncbi:cytochrome c oxidase assembly protein [Alkalihalobacillus sp. AL-G]|uniref:cytochrome c oxidase assembly protein n=1 Tax=Alkalihalobacillus sp. AL-G TaxID=2926399 RepID=UPI00272D03D5|nr:cytochrome c oxidase assembly protein [Alkalihalobacillus sp. AL-G]WLD95032.1 cytochrome c oxidase assembly protein [Alkalihalobacillus sp. AL-G]
MHNHQDIGSLSEFGMTTLWNPFVLLLSVAVLGIYFFYTHKGPYKDKVTRLQQVWFTVAVICVYVAKGTPLSVIGHHYSFTFHMIQMSLLYFIVPPLALIGLPADFLRKIINMKGIKRTFHFFTQPLIALLLFNLLISFYHLPFIFDSIMAQPLLHEPYHVVLLLTSIFMWWPVIAPLPEENRLSDLQKVGYIFADGVLLTPACALIIFADTIIYDTYMNAPQIFEYLAPLDDQQAGGVIMKIAQEIIYGGILLYILIRWVRKERKNDKEEEQKIIEEARARLSLNE